MSEVKTELSLTDIMRQLNDRKLTTIEGVLKWTAQDERVRGGEEEYTGTERRIIELAPGDKHERVLYEGTLKIKPTAATMYRIDCKEMFAGTSVTPVGKDGWTREGSNGNACLALNTSQYGKMRLYLK